MNNWDNEHCGIAARMLNRKPEALDPELVKYLNNIAHLVNCVDGVLVSRQVIAAAVINWQEKQKEE